jgi:hypothetical protein
MRYDITISIMRYDENPYFIGVNLSVVYWSYYIVRSI